VDGCARFLSSIDHREERGNDDDDDDSFIFIMLWTLAFKKKIQNRIFSLVFFAEFGCDACLLTLVHATRHTTPNAFSFFLLRTPQKPPLDDTSFEL
jgi:hypothetical protein